MVSEFIQYFPTQANSMHYIPLQCSQISIDYAHIYFLRIRQYIPIKHSNQIVYLACLAISDKYTSDYPIKNRTISHYYRVPLDYLNFMELWIIQLMEYHLEISASEWYMNHQMNGMNRRYSMPCRLPSY
eukprot:NODE_45_length_32908_cov_0.790271.p26 type:complete len:129 gc:universal NODE_45_length_32908_cov_0.790271:7276-7662(+)